MSICCCVTSAAVFCALISITGFHAFGRDAADFFIKRLPHPVEWTAPDGLPATPGDKFHTDFAPPATGVVPDAPVISEWNRTAHPGESFTMSGISFTRRSSVDAGSDTTVWVWADAPDGGKLCQALVWSVKDSILMATLPDDIPFGMYMVWVENEAGISAPVTLNRTMPQWLGPLGNEARACEEKRVFGRNLATTHGTETSNVFITQVGRMQLQRCEVKEVEPYSVRFIIPEALANGEYYVYVHNGHGGQYGWGDSLSLVIHSRQPADRVIVVPPDAEGVAQAIQHAIDELHEQPDGGTVRLNAGEYNVTEEVVLKSSVRLTGVGKRETIFTGNRLLVMSNTAVEDMTLANGLRSFEAAPAVLRDVRFADISTLRMAWRGMWHERIEVSDSDVAIIDMPGADMWFHGNFITGDTNYDHAGIYPFGSRVVIERNHFQNEWPVAEDGKPIMSSSPVIPHEGHRTPEPPWIARVVCATSLTIPART